MPTCELIHSTSDVQRALNIALDLGLRVIVDDPQDKPRPLEIRRSDIAKYTSGSFQLIHPEWIVRELEMGPIDEGMNAGRFYLRPRTNYAGVTLYFHGEQSHGQDTRLGGGLLSFHRNWLLYPELVIKPTPKAVETVYKKMRSKLFSGVTVKGGVHRYHLCHGALTRIRSEKVLPPFDYIVWSHDVFGENEP